MTNVIKIDEPGTYKLVPVATEPDSPVKPSRPSSPVRPKKIIDLPTLAAANDEFRVGVYGSTTYVNDRFRSFLVCNDADMNWYLAVSESEDGVNWSERQRIVDGVQCASVQFDGEYRGLFCKDHKYVTGQSRDGLTWSFEDYASGEDVCSHCEGIYLHKVHRSDDGGPSDDRVWYCNNASTTGLNEVTGSDGVDEIETYQLGLMKDGDTYVGFRSTFFTNELPSGSEGGVIYPVLALSKDGKAWEMPYDYQPLIKNHDGMLMCQSQPIIVGDELWLYVFETSYEHNGYRDALAGGTATHGMKLVVWDLAEFRSMYATDVTLPPSLEVDPDNWTEFQAFDTAMPVGTEERAVYLRRGRSLAGDPQDYWHAIALWRQDGKPNVSPAPPPRETIWSVDATQLGQEYDDWAASLNDLRKTSPSPGWNAWQRFGDIRCIAKHMAPRLVNGFLRFEVEQSSPDHHCHITNRGSTRLEFDRTYHLRLKLRIPPTALAWANATPWCCPAQFWGKAALNPPFALMIKRGAWAIQHYAAVIRPPESNDEWALNRLDYSQNNLQPIDNAGRWTDIEMTYRPSITANGLAALSIDGVELYRQTGPNAIIDHPPLCTVGLYTPSTSITSPAVIEMSAIDLSADK